MVIGLTETEDIKRLQEYTEVYNQSLNDPDNHDGVITHLEPNILECEFKRVLNKATNFTRTITMNKATGGGIPAELFQILNDDALKVLYSKCQQIWKTQQWPQDWKSWFSFQSQRRAMPRNVQTTTKLYSFNMLAR